MNDVLLRALYFFLQVLLYAGSWFVAWISVLGVIVIYRKMKKEVDKEKRKLDEIIVKRNEEKDRADKEIQNKSEELKNLEQLILNKKQELGIIESSESLSEAIKTPEVVKPVESIKSDQSTPATPKAQPRAKKPKK